MRAGLRVVQAVAGVVVQQQCFGSVDGRVQLWTGIQVLPVQVHTPGVSPAKTGRSVRSPENPSVLRCTEGACRRVVLTCSAHVQPRLG